MQELMLFLMTSHFLGFRGLREGLPDRLEAAGQGLHPVLVGVADQRQEGALQSLGALLRRFRFLGEKTIWLG